MRNKQEDILLASIRRKTGAAIGRFDLIQAGDVIGIGLSGGKDSVTMLKVLTKLREYAPIPFTIKAITIDLGWGIDQAFLEALCQSHNVPLYIESTQIGEIVFTHRDEKNPCSLCANLRRGAVNNAAKSLGCNKVALGHHLDDMLETLLLGLFFEGRLHTFSPKSYLSRKDLTVIRPMIFVEESEILAAAEALAYPSPKKGCPVDGTTKRHRMKELIASLNVEIPDIRKKMLSAVQTVDFDPVWSKE
jgi:tRNA 2-thiocytidine biosynthesis protein TtcA